MIFHIFFVYQMFCLFPVPACPSVIPSFLSPLAPRSPQLSGVASAWSKYRPSGCARGDLKTADVSWSKWEPYLLDIAIVCDKTVSISEDVTWTWKYIHIFCVNMAFPIISWKKWWKHEHLWVKTYLQWQAETAHKLKTQQNWSSLHPDTFEILRATVGYMSAWSSQPDLFCFFSAWPPTNHLMFKKDQKRFK